MAGTGLCCIRPTRQKTGRSKLHPHGYDGMSIPEIVLKPLRILLAEDNPLNRKIVSAMLERRGHDVVTVENGRQAITALLNSSFDLVLMDIAMPHMDGVQTAEVIRSSVTEQVDSSIPIIALTAHYLEKDRERYVAAGMDGFLSKPVRINVLLRTIQDVMRRKGVDVILPASDADTPVAKKANLRELATVTEEFGLDYHDIIALYGSLMESVPAEFAALKVAAKEGWVEEIGEMAHTLAGSALDIVSEGPSLLAREIEHSARSGDLQDIPSLIVEMEEQVDVVLNSMTTILANA